VLLHTASVYTRRNFLHRDAFTQEEAFAHSKLYTQNLLHTASFYRKKSLHREVFLYIITTGIAAPKPDLDAKAKKKTILNHFLKGLLKGKLLAPKMKKSADKSLLQP